MAGGKSGSAPYSATENSAEGRRADAEAEADETDGGRAAVGEEPLGPAAPPPIIVRGSAPVVLLPRSVTAVAVLTAAVVEVVAVLLG